MSTRTVSINNSAPRAGLVKMPTYTIQEDAPWVAARPASAVPSSVYSDEPTVLIMDHDTSPRSAKSQNYNIREAQIPDHGPHATRQSRLPIFSQVRTMLSSSKSPGATSNTSINNNKSDDMSSQPPTPGKTAQSKSSAWDGVFNARRYSPGLKSLKTKKNSSNVSVLRDSETSSVASNPSSLSLASPIHSPAPSQISVNVTPQLPSGVNAPHQVKRKPVMSLSQSQTENLPPQDLLAVPDTHLTSRFSWSTAAPSEAPKRQSTDTMATGGRPPLMSHFSWTTIGTSAAPTPNEELGDPNDIPPVPSPHLEQTTFSDPPAESILSRKRPVQRLDYEDRTPSTPRQRADTATSIDSPSSTPRARNFNNANQDPDATPRKATPTSHPAPNSTGKKALPLLPFMSEQQASHLEMLITQEKNLVMQRKNVERSIADLEAIERASPLEVSFAAVRDARRRLDERRETLREIKMEEMDIGIRIARARRKEDFGEGEGTLWVRRVTG
ncbi:hypothetical protein Q7P37_010214 [Cladosporium fusiforme]